MSFRSCSIALLTVVIAGCATNQPVQTKHNAGPISSPLTTHAPQRVIFFVPLTEGSATAAIKLLEHSPHLRMTLVVSPRFSGFKDPALKNRVNALLQNHRLELGVQLPNPPIVPLLIDMNSAKNSLPPGSNVLTPPFSFQEDVIQLIARAKADFFRVWGFLPHGIALPYGAASTQTLTLLDQQGFSWSVEAIGAPPTDGAYRTGSLLVFDAVPKKAGSTTVLVYDERASKDGTKPLPTLEAWSQGISTIGVTAVLPSDTGITTQPLPAQISHRTWTQPDWSLWIGDRPKDAAWSWLRKTREALEKYKNSGNASVQRLDMAFEEIYTAENANYFLIPHDLETNPSAEERVHEFQATLSSVFRLMGQQTPDDLFSEPATTGAPGVHASSTTANYQSLPDGSDHVVFTDALGDDRGDGQMPEAPEPHSMGSYDLRQFDVWAASETLTWSVTLGAPGTPLVDIYVDLNGQSGLGTVSLLPDRALSAASSDAWEYALTIYKQHAVLYRTLSGGTYDLVGTFPVVTDGSTLKVVMPRTTIHGSPRKWGYQVLVMARDPASPELSPRPWIPANHKGPPVYDLLDPLEVPQQQLLSDIETGARSDLPFVRVPR